MPVLARIWLAGLLSDTSPAPAVAIDSELVMICPVEPLAVSSVTPPAVVSIAIVPTFRMPDPPIARLVAVRTSESAVTPAAIVRLPVSFRLIPPL